MAENFRSLIVLMSFMSCSPDKELRPSKTPILVSRSSRITGKANMTIFRKLVLSDTRSKISV